MVKDVFLNAQKYSKPFKKKDTIIGTDQIVSDVAKSLVKGEDIEIQTKHNKKSTNIKQRVHFDYHSEIFDF